MTIFTVLALAGIAGFLTTHALVQFGMLDGNSLRYSIANVAASSMVLATLLDRFDLHLALLIGAWATLGLIGVATRLRPRAPAATRLSLVPALDHAAPAGADSGPHGNVRRLAQLPRHRYLTRTVSQNPA